ncbi:archease [Acidianus sulfidivorans JP7]|uniref:Protein archease n=1 Tax=Acidianus sulfidivorans JP7 TaxID=619593 RepID=A0A2U9IMT4_9CREN|nr:archease [Acidianus sulfidivorans]AWR97310.1 archease [Acidianus sulfidivorans JP7]
MKKFEFFDNTADVGIKAYGSTLEEAFENAALAVFEVMTNTSQIRPIEMREVEIDGTDLENLLYKWIESLLVFYDSELLVFSKFKVNIDLNNMKLHGVAYGEKFKEEFERRTLVKAMTYSLMSINKVGDHYEITFVVDI